MINAALSSIVEHDQILGRKIHVRELMRKKLSHFCTLFRITYRNDLLCEIGMYPCRSKNYYFKRTCRCEIVCKYNVNFTCNKSYKRNYLAIMTKIDITKIHMIVIMYKILKNLYFFLCLFIQYCNCKFALLNHMSICTLSLVSIQIC